MTGADTSPKLASGPRWHWFALGAALIESVAFRLPLILNAPTHLDSDLAVDGLTLLEATRGHLRWHYPGTPHIGSLPSLIGLPFAWAGGVNPTTLAISGTVIHLLVIVATFLLALRLYGSTTAACSLVPMTLASSGVVWLSGRITGGHLLAVAWHAVAFSILYRCLTRGGWRTAACLGVWCGLGIWNDSIFLLTLAGLLPAAILGGWRSAFSRTGIVAIGAFAVGMALGLIPRVVGDRVDPYDAYHDQFAPIWQGEVLLNHARILGLDALPRLIVGHRLPGLEAEPGGIGPDGQAVPAATVGGGTAILTVGFGGLMFLVAIAGLLNDRGDPARRAVVAGLLTSCVVTIVGFVINRNIFNSDNYRYLVLILVPWAIGFGQSLDSIGRRGRFGFLVAMMIGVLFAVVFLKDVTAWYRRLGWVEGPARPVTQPLRDPILTWLDAHREVGRLYGGYWDVYRLSFLTGGRVQGVPSAHYPNRFPDPSAGHPPYVIARGTAVGAEIRRQALADGGREVFRTAGGVVVTWP